MQKYRRWTDQATGINPFVFANSQPPNFINKSIAFLIILIKGTIFVSYIPVFIILYLIPLGFVRKCAARVALLLVGLYTKEDYSLEKLQSEKRNIILSNHTCFLDALYFIYRYPGCSFLVFHQDQEGKFTYSKISALSVFFKVFTSLQIFYRKDGKGVSLKEVVQQSKGKLIVFYEKIRTNGRGTIKIDKSLTDDIYQLQRDVIITQIKYPTKNDGLFSLTASAISVLFSALSSIFSGNNIKLRATKQDYKDTHSSNELREAVNTMSVGALLQTKPKSYFQFLDFYKKTQKQAYKLEQ